MIRFSYDSDDGVFAHFCIEGDNEHGYVFLAYNDAADIGGDEDTFVQKWFETLAEAMTHAGDQFGILKGQWNAPVSGVGTGTFRGRPSRRGASTVLNEENVRDREDNDANDDAIEDEESDDADS